MKMNLNQNVKQTLQSRILTLINRRGEWEGTMTQFNQVITNGRTIPAEWPSTPSVMRRAVNTVAPSLRKLGVRVKFSRTTDHSRTRVVSFVQV